MRPSNSSSSAVRVDSPHIDLFYSLALDVLDEQLDGNAIDEDVMERLIDAVYAAVRQRQDCLDVMMGAMLRHIATGVIGVLESETEIPF